MQNQIPKGWQKVGDFLLMNARVFILLFLIGASVISFILSAITPDLWKDILVNLSASFIMALITIFGIDFLSSLHSRRKWREAEQVAKEDLFRLGNMMITYVATPFGESVLNYKRDTKQDLEKWSLDITDHILNGLEKRDVEKLISALTDDKWKHFEMNLLFLKPSIDSSITVYDEVLPAELYGKLLKVRKKFNDFYFQFGLINIGWDNKSLVSSYLRAALEGYFKEYLRAVSDFRKELNKW